jgi:plasmid stabilization system protein ParE
MNRALDAASEALIQRELDRGHCTFPAEVVARALELLNSRKTGSTATAKPSPSASNPASSKAAEVRCTPPKKRASSSRNVEPPASSDRLSPHRLGYRGHRRPPHLHHRKLQRREQAGRLEITLFSLFARIATFLGLGHRRFDLTRRPFLFFSEKPYLIVYERDHNPLIIHAILHSTRDVRSALRHRPLSSPTPPPAAYHPQRSTTPLPPFAS